jgi:hypothetical protein
LFQFEKNKSQKAPIMASIFHPSSYDQFSELATAMKIKPDTLKLIQEIITTRNVDPSSLELVVNIIQSCICTDYLQPMLKNLFLTVNDKKVESNNSAASIHTAASSSPPMIPNPPEPQQKLSTPIIQDSAEESKANPMGLNATPCNSSSITSLTQNEFRDMVIAHLSEHLSDLSINPSLSINTDVTQSLTIGKAHFTHGIQGRSNSHTVQTYGTCTFCYDITFRNLKIKMEPLSLLINFHMKNNAYRLRLTPGFFMLKAAKRGGDMLHFRKLKITDPVHDNVHRALHHTFHSDLSKYQSYLSASQDAKIKILQWNPDERYFTKQYKSISNNLYKKSLMIEMIDIYIRHLFSIYASCD